MSRFSKTWRPVIDESKCLETVNGAACSKCAIACEADIEPAASRFRRAHSGRLHAMPSLCGRVSGEGGQHAVFGEERCGASGKHGRAGRHRREDGRVMDGRASEPIAVEPKYRSVLDGVSSEAIVVHREAGARKCATATSRA